MSPRALAQLIDGLAGDQCLVVSEGRGPSVSLHGVSAKDAGDVVRSLDQLGWHYEIEDSAERPVAPSELWSALPPLQIHFKKPMSHDVRFLTLGAFEHWLLAPEPVGAVEVARVTTPFATEAFTVRCWNAPSEPSCRAERKSPRKIVRSYSGANPIPSDIRPFLLVDAIDIPWKDSVFQVWALASASSLVMSIASEVDSKSHAIFLGPPRAEIGPFDTQWLDLLGSEGFIALQRAAMWVYENERETETRHRLFVPEFSRGFVGEQDAATKLSRSLLNAIEGARIAFQLGLLDLSRDTLKTLADLRKSVADETSKLADSTRQLALGVAGSVVYGLSLIAARMTGKVAPFLLDLMAIAGLAYVGALIFVNFRFLQEQRTIRVEWRERLYRFLTTNDYEAMVGGPAKKAESILNTAMWISGVIAAITFFAVIVNNH